MTVQTKQKKRAACAGSQVSSHLLITMMDPFWRLYLATCDLIT